MGNLTHDIELYLKSLLDEADEGVLVVQRSVLSEMFCCVPSQINYVLRTRFTPTNGYIVETRRGGGGYVRIQSIPINSAHDFRPLMDASRQSLTEKDAEGILTYLVEEDVIPPDVGTLLQSIMKERVLQLPQPMTTGELRAHLMMHLLAHMSLGDKVGQKKKSKSSKKDASCETAHPQEQDDLIKE